MPLVVNGIKVCAIEPDFRFQELTDKGWIEVISECKGFWEDDSKIKWKLLQALYPEFEYRLIKKEDVRRW